MLAQFYLTPLRGLAEVACREGIAGIEEKAARKDLLRAVIESTKY